MKKLILSAFVFIMVLGGSFVGASLLKVNLTSQGHMTATSDAIQIDGGRSTTSKSTTTFEVIDEDQAQFKPQGTWNDIFAFESKTDVNVTYTLTMYKNGTQWDTDKFSVLLRVDNMNKTDGFQLYADMSKDVEVIVYLHESLAFDEMGQEVSFEIDFYVT